MKVVQTQGYVNNVREEEVLDALNLIKSDPRFLTKPTIQKGFPVPFVDFHMHFLKTHPTINPRHYVSNLRLILKTDNS